MNSIDKILSLADHYALRNYHHDDPDNREAARQALQDELVRLFTPLSDEQIESLVTWEGDKNDPHYNRIRHGRSIEKAHGIGGES